jgi:hypothetical protein
VHVFRSRSPSPNSATRARAALGLGASRLEAQPMSRILRVLVLVSTPALSFAAPPVDTFVQEAYLKASNTTNGTVNGFGGAIALSGDTLVVGSIGEDSGSSGVNGNQFNVNAPNSGAVYVFVRSGSGWAQQAYLKSFNPVAGDSFGSSVALDGDTLVVGCPGQDSTASNSGAAFVFVRQAGVWSQQAFLKANNAGASDNFGRSVAISGETLIVGAPNEDSNATGVNGLQSNNSAGNAGAAYVYVRNGSSWLTQAYLKASNTEANDEFGYSVALYGDTAVVGAVNEDSNAVGINGLQSNNSQSNAGAAYVFTRSANAWSQQAYVKPSNTDNGDQFGIALALHGETLVVGSAGESSASAGVNGNQADESLPSAGAAYVYVRNGASWSQQAYIKASNPSPDDLFGIELALDGDTLVVGAFHENSSALGVNGNQLDESADDAGAAYVYERNGTAWSQLAYLKASNTEAGDDFGGATAVSGDLVVCSSHYESSSATGVNGDQLDNSAAQAGACYVFERQANSFAVLSGCFSLNSAALSSASSGLELGQSVAIQLAAGNYPTGLGLLYFGSDGTNDFDCGVPLPGFGELLLGFVPSPALLGTVPVVGGAAQFNATVPANPALVGIKVALQAANANLLGPGFELSNALVSTIAP